VRFRALLLPLALVSCRAEEDPMARLVRAVSPPRLERTVRRLAAFETRHTASAADDPARGIGAARRWIEDELEQIAGLEVGTQAFPAAGNQRLDAGVEIVNVYAVLAGTSARDRYYVVSGHYDSRALDPRDARSRAPGANDDASGVAVVLELARIFAAHPTEASLIFLCVAGEEQGLLGSRHFARDAREKGLHIAGMLTNDIVGNTLGPRGRRHRRYVRVFSEGTPVAETTHAMASRLRRSLGAEWDSPSRQLARYVREQAAAHLRSFQVKLVFRPDRFLRGGDHLGFNEAGYAAVRLTEPFDDSSRSLRSPTRRHRRAACASTPKRSSTQRRSPGSPPPRTTSPTTRWCGATRPRPTGSAVARSGARPRSRSRSRRTTGTSVSAPSTATASGAR
jgi:hypothetical protein